MEATVPDQFHIETQSPPMAAWPRRASSNPQLTGPKTGIRVTVMTQRWFISCCVLDTMRRADVLHLLQANLCSVLMKCKQVLFLPPSHQCRHQGYQGHVRSQGCRHLSCRQLSCMGADWDQRGPCGPQVAACRTSRCAGLNLRSAACAGADMGKVGAGAGA